MKDRFELPKLEGELRYTGKLDLRLTEEDLKRVNLILPDGLHVIGTSREDAQKLVDERMNGNGKAKEKHRIPDKSWFGAHHFGKCDIKDLLDLIYGKEEG